MRRGHVDGWRIEHNGTRSFRGGCTCWPCVLRRAPTALADALFGLRLAITVWRQHGRRR